MGVGPPAYQVTKAALNALTRCGSSELKTPVSQGVLIPASRTLSPERLASGRALPMRSEFRLGLPCRREFARVAAQIFSGRLNSIVGDRYA